MALTSAPKSPSKPPEPAADRERKGSDRLTEKMAVFTVRPAREEGGKDYWTEIGTLFPHERGEGFTILLNALPLDAKLVVLPRREQPPRGEQAA